MKRVLAALAALLIATAAHASHGKPFPWTRFSEQAADAVNAGVASCRGQETFMAQFAKDGVTYLFYYGTESERFVFAEMGEDGKPVRLYFGRALPSPRHDEIVITSHRPFDPEQDAGGPCPHVAGGKA